MRNDRERLADILEALDKIERYTPRGKQAFENDEMFQVWVVRHLQIIGEAASIHRSYPKMLWSELDCNQWNSDRRT